MFKDIKVGDHVVIRHMRSDSHIGIVTRVTNKYFEVGPYLYRKDNGHLRGSDGWFSSWAVEATHSVVAEIEERDRRNNLHFVISRKIESLKENVTHRNLQELEFINKKLDEILKDFS